MDTIYTIVTDCEEYWRNTRVPSKAVSEMSAELEGHLRDAAAHG